MARFAAGALGRHPRPSIDVLADAAKRLHYFLTTAEKNVRATHTNRSPINPVQFNDASVGIRG
jgi:hypothetical protein